MNLPIYGSRRLGQRHAVHGVVVDWNTGGRRRPAWRRLFAEADVVDVSVSGAQLLAPRDERLRLRQHVTIGAAGAIGRVRIARMTDMSNGRLRIYGVEFVELEPALEALLFSQIAADRPGDIEDVWQHSF